MQPTVVIPARLASSRLPGKPFAQISGAPMLWWVINSASKAVGRENVFVASCDAEILKFAEEESVRGIMTADTHERATDRTNEAIRRLALEGRFIEKVIMLQGDEPAIAPSSLLEILEVMDSNSGIKILNLIGEIRSEDELLSPNTIKVVKTIDDKALYLSRLPVPHGRAIGSGVHWKQVCAMGFTKESLAAFSQMEATGLEKSESIDMLRWIENGEELHLHPISYETHPVDVFEDIKAVERILAAREQGW